MERTEKIGLGFATAGHVLLFGLLSAGYLMQPDPLKLAPDPMDVTLVGEVALDSGSPRPAPPAPAAAPDPGPSESAAPAPAPQPAPVVSPPKPERPIPAPRPEPKPEPKPKPKPAPAPKASAKPAPKPQPDKRAEAKPSSSPPSSSSKPAARPAPPKQAASGSGAKSANRGPKLTLDPSKWTQGSSSATAPSTSTGQSNKMSREETISLNNEISRQIYQHLRLPSGVDVEQLVAVLEVRLNRDGSVDGQPKVLDITGITASNQPQVALYRERAVQAVMQASPFQNLPVKFYDEWRWLKPLRVYARKAM